MKRRDAQVIQDIREYLDENLYKSHSIRDLCKRFMINREKLQLGFHELVKSTVHAYIIRQRIERAAKQLVESDDSVKAIALDSGYKKQRSFNKNIMAEIEKLPRQRKAIVRLYFFEQKSTAEIAEQLGLNSQTVLNHKSKALESLRKSGLKFKWLLEGVPGFLLAAAFYLLK